MRAIHLTKDQYPECTKKKKTQSQECGGLIQKMGLEPVTFKKYLKRHSSPLAIGEMQIKTILGRHLASVRTAKINGTTDKRCWRGGGQKGNPNLLMKELQIDAATKEIRVVNSQKH